MLMPGRRSIVDEIRVAVCDAEDSHAWVWVLGSGKWPRRRDKTKLRCWRCGDEKPMNPEESGFSKEEMRATRRALHRL